MKPETENPNMASFRHPVSGDVVEFSLNLSSEQRLRLISNADTIYLDFEKLRFQAFFPDSIQPISFNETSVGRHPEADLQPGQKAVWRELLGYLGYKSPRKKDAIEAGDIPELNVAFTSDKYALMNMLNGLLSVQRMRSIAQTEPGIMLMPESTRELKNLEKYSLWHHVNHLAYSFAMTNFRMALINPWLYLERTAKDINEFEYQYEKRYGETKKFTMKPSDEVVALVDRLMENVKGEKTYALEQAIQQAIEWGKYYGIYALIHDIESPALKDVFMKATKRVEGQKSATLSEDEELITGIDHYIRYDLEPIIKRHNLDPELLRVVVASLASENSPTLGGYLIKDKRKGLTQRPDFAFVPTGQGFDHDQQSGTLTNGAFLVNRYLPGGFKHKDKQTEDPIGSFEERARLLAFAAVTNMSKEKLMETLKELSIDPNRVYISAEEVAVWPNVVLKEIHGKTVAGKDATEIIPVSLRPGDAKRGIQFQNLLYTFYYFGAKRFTAELWSQDVIAFGLGSGAFRERDFISRSDFDIVKILSRTFPAFRPILTDRHFYDEAFVLSEDELFTYADQDGVLSDALVTQLEQFPDPILLKEGTLVVDDNGAVLSYADVVQQKRTARLNGDTGVHADSLRARQQAVTRVIRQSPWYLVMRLPVEKQTEMLELFTESTNDPVKQTFYLWTEPVVIKERVIRSTLRDVFFPPETILEGRSE